jgi:hypothetical protein
VAAPGDLNYTRASHCLKNDSALKCRIKDLFMLKRLLASGLIILIVWTVLDLLFHRFLLRQMYEDNPNLWRPFDQMNVVLIYIVIFILIGTFVGTYWVLVRPKSLAAGIGLGAFVGLALGVSAGFGTYIHMPISQGLAWGWLIAGWLKGVAAGAIVGAVIKEPPERR